MNEDDELNLAAEIRMTPLQRGVDDMEKCVDWWTASIGVMRVWRTDDRQIQYFGK